MSPETSKDNLADVSDVLAAETSSPDVTISMFAVQPRSAGAASNPRKRRLLLLLTLNEKKLQIANQEIKLL